MRRLFLLFALVPFVELYLLIAIGREVGLLPTLAMVLLTGMLGATLARREGLRVLNQYQSSVAQGRLPEEGVLGGVLVLLGGLLLVVPGVLTDVVGLLLLIPPSRRFIEARVRHRLEAGMRSGQVHVGGFGFPRPPSAPPPSRPSSEEPSPQRWREASLRRSDDRADVVDAEIVDEPREH